MRTTITDVYEGSYLLANGVELVEVWVDRGRRRQTVVFAFEGGSELEELQRTYHRGTAQVNICTYRQCLNTIRKHLRGALTKHSKEGTPRYESTGTEANH